MKKVVSVALVVGLIFAAMMVPAEAGKKKKRKPAPAPSPTKVTRVVTGNYIAPALGVGLCTQEDGVGCMEIPSGAEEAYLTAKVADSTGQPVFISIQADTDGDNISDTKYGFFCGETTEPIKFDPGVSLIFWVSPGAGASSGAANIQDRVAAGCLPGEGTQGTIEITFSNLP